MKYLLRNRARLLAITIGLMLTMTFAQATTYFGKTGSAPNTLTNWGTTTGGGGTNPASFISAGDVFIIENGTTMTATGAWLIGAGGTTASTLQINSGGTLILNNYLLTLSSCDFTNAGTLTITSGGLTISGTLVTNSIAGLTTTGTITLTKTGGTATFTGNVSGGALTINGSGGTLNLGAGLTHTISGQVTLTAGTLNGGSSSIYVNGNETNTWTGTGSNFSAGTGTVVLGGTNQTISTPTTFNNLTVSGSGTKTFTSSTVNGVLSIEGSATVSAAPNYGASATLQYNTATARTATSEWLTPFVATGGVIIKNTGAITINSAKVLGNSTNVPLNIWSGATLVIANKGLTFHGDFINNGTLSATNPPIIITGTYSTQNIGAIPMSGNGSVSMTKTGGTATFTGNVITGTLTINGTGGTLNVGVGLTHTFSGIITLTAGTLNGGSSTLNENATSTTAWSGTGSLFSAGTGTVNFGGAAQTLSATATTFKNLTFSNSGLKTITTANVIVNGILSMEGTATVSAAVT